MSIFHYYDLDYCELFVLDEFIINQIKEGEVITPEHSEVLKTIIKKHFDQKPMAYISNRTMSYAVNPLAYIHAAKIENLVAIAIVTQEDNFINNAQYERNFYKKRFEVFHSLSEAITWAHMVIAEN